MWLEQTVKEVTEGTGHAGPEGIGPSEMKLFLGALEGFWQSKGVPPFHIVFFF